MLYSSKLLPKRVFVTGRRNHKDLPIFSPNTRNLSYKLQSRGTPLRRVNLISLAISNQKTGELSRFHTVREEDSEECTKRLLEWDELCVHVGRFAQTNTGKLTCRKLTIANSYTEAIYLQNETKAVEVLEAKLKVEFKFGNVSTELMISALERCSKGGILTAEQLMSISGLISSTQDLKKVILAPFRKSGLYKDLREAAGVVYSPWKRVEIPLELKSLIDFAIDSEGNIKDNASSNLSSARKSYRTIKKRLESLMRTFKGKVVERSGRMCLALNSGKEVPSKALILDSGSSGTIYCEPRGALSLNNQMEAIYGEMKNAEDTVLANLTELVTQQIHELNELFQMMISLDVALARLRYTQWIDGSFPRFSCEENDSTEALDSDFFISLMNLRHPLLMGQSLIYKQANSRRRIQDDFKFEAPIPNDVILFPQTRALVITGPNAGGKTATLKALGLCALMAKAGLGLPAKQPVWIPYYSAVLADIGDEQSLNASLSTFSGHLRRIQNLRIKADGKCLVLLDELGTGTDPKEGAAFGAALLKRLVQGGAGGALTTVVSTHHALLTTLAYDQEAEEGYSVFENASMEFDDENLAPTYRLMMGVPGQSNALNIASRLGMDLRIIGGAKSLLGQRHASENILIAQIRDEQERLEEVSEQIETLENKMKELEAQMVDMEVKNNTLEFQVTAQEADVYFKAYDHGQASLKLLNHEKQKKKKKTLSTRKPPVSQTPPVSSTQQESTSEDKEELKEKEKEAVEVKEEVKKKKAANWSPEVGELVYVKDLGTTGTVIELQSKNQLLIRAGLLTITVNRASLEPF
eukprot:g6771.t1